jgi:alpha-amylase/alpha-mannosidase (GH57 family)
MRVVSERYLCIHCHFYQPPRENPWLEAIELQDSAYPCHDWNERIAIECYSPNSAARILDPQRRIAQIVNNYERISFNFGPTLLSWMEEKVPDTYAQILAADQKSVTRFSGHGSAIAQAYNHMILPLANERDKRTQVRWGLEDFRTRFHRDPEGMWLPEAAVDLDTLEVLADNGIKFTILAPLQARLVLSQRRGVWKSVEGGKIDPTRPYVCELPSGRSLALFFYDGPISRAVAFEGLLSDGENFAQRLLNAFNDARRWPQLVHIATDGESYGHHSTHGDMALAYALNYIESRQLARITNYGEYLAKFPPTREVQISENTSWSCVHGIERWRADCGCNSGGYAGWNQQWREPLRAALDSLRDNVAGPYEEQARALLKDPWGARDEYIRVVLDRSRGSLAGFFQRWATHPLEGAELVRALKLLELQRHAMLMYTSCGWFFDELSGIETTQVIFYAGRALQLARELFGDHLQESFLERLALAHSNLPEHGDGARIFERSVRPAMVDLLAVGAHYAISSAFGGFAPQNAIYCYEIDRHDYRSEQAGRARLTMGHAGIRSQITREEAEIAFAVLHFGDHDLHAGVRHFAGEREYSETVEDLTKAFASGDIPAVLRRMDRHFTGNGYSLRSLFRDEQRRILKQIMSGVLSETEASYRGIYERNAQLMRFLTDVRMPLPSVLRVTAEFVLNSSLRREFEEPQLNFERIAGVVESARQEGVTFNAGTRYALRLRLEQTMDALAASPADLSRLTEMETVVQLAISLAFELDLWKVQNRYWQILQTVYPASLSATDQASREWITHFAALGNLLGVKLGITEPAEIRLAA